MYIDILLIVYHAVESFHQDEEVRFVHELFAVEVSANERDHQ
jgi:hypothetical protein